MMARSLCFARSIAATIALLTILGVQGLLAQEDYRSLDAGRPILVTDAFPLKHKEWEIQFGVRGRVAEDRRGASGALAIEAGILRNTAFGVEFEPAVEREGGRSANGVEALSLHFLHNVVRESWGWPAVAVRVDADAPIGGRLGRNSWGISSQLVATRTLASGLRFHGNGGYAAAAARDGGDAWVAGLAADYALGFSGRMLVADVYTEIPASGGRSRLWLEVGARVQISNTSVLDLGLASRADEWRQGANMELVLGISRTFGIRSLTRVPAMPPPEIR